MPCCVFFGHKDADSSISSRVKEAIIKLIREQGVNEFFVGNNGKFDYIVYSALKEIKSEYPNITYSVALAYLPGIKPEYENYYADEETLLPDGIEVGPARFAIDRRNKWMVEQADYVITHVTHSWGGAAKFKELAEKGENRSLTLAQEESRKVSERVKAGQQISRQNGMVYGCGNILGYDRQVGETYRINPEQAETVRMIYDMYLDGLSTMAIANELTRCQRLNASGKNKWTAGVVCRILNNQTYMGVMAYGKSFSNNYLEQKRVNNHDASTYMCVKSDFEPIVSEEEWYKCQEIKAKRVKQTMSAANTANKQKRHHGTKENRDLWGSKLQCSCGHSFRKNRWHKNNNMPWSYGYQCYNQLNNGSAASRRKAGVDDTGYCDQPMIADWKLDLMAKFIFQRIWIDKNEVISKTCDLIDECYRADVPKKVNLTGVASQIEKYRAKKNNLLDMRTDGEITKEEFAVQKQKIDAVLADLENEYASMLQSEQEIRVPDLRCDEIKETLTQILDFSQPQVNPDLIRRFVSKIVPDGKNHFRWYMNLDRHDTTSLDVVTEGRKSNAVVTFDSGGDKPPLHTGDVITISQLKEKKSSTLSILHRLQLKTRGIKQKSQ